MLLMVMSPAFVFSVLSFPFIVSHKKCPLQPIIPNCRCVSVVKWSHWLPHIPNSTVSLFGPLFAMSLSFHLNLVLLYTFLREHATAISLYTHLSFYVDILKLSFHLALSPPLKVGQED